MLAVHHRPSLRELRRHSSQCLLITENTGCGAHVPSTLGEAVRTDAASCRLMTGRYRRHRSTRQGLEEATAARQSSYKPVVVYHW